MDLMNVYVVIFLKGKTVIFFKKKQEPKIQWKLTRGTN